MDLPRNAMRFVLLIAISFEFLSGCRQGSLELPVSNGCFNAIWAWYFPYKEEEQRELVRRASGSNISFIFLHMYSPQINSQGYKLPEFDIIKSLDIIAQSKQVRIFAAYGSPDWIHQECDSTIIPLLEGLVQYLEITKESMIQGVILDIEPSEPISQDSFLAMLNFFQCVKEYLHNNDLKIAIAFRYFWKDTIHFNNVSKPVFQHIMDIADLSVIMSYRDFAGDTCPDNGIICLSEDAVSYAAQINKPILLGIETMDCVPWCGPEHVTFYEEGLSVMNEEARKVMKHFYNNAKFGFAIHAYEQEYLKGGQGWLKLNQQFPCPIY